MGKSKLKISTNAQRLKTIIESTNPRDARIATAIRSKVPPDTLKRHCEGTGKPSAKWIVFYDIFLDFEVHEWLPPSEFRKMRKSAELARMEVHAPNLKPELFVGANGRRIDSN